VVPRHPLCAKKGQLSMLVLEINAILILGALIRDVKILDAVISKVLNTDVWEIYVS